MSSDKVVPNITETKVSNGEKSLVRSKSFSFLKQQNKAQAPKSSGPTNIEVAVRCRPLSNEERKTAQASAVTCDTETNTVKLTYGVGGKKVTKNTDFDRVFGMYSRQAEVYEAMVKPIVEEAIWGFNCTVFAYGPTGTGKTYTMEGDLNDENNWGMIPRAAKTIFEYLNAAKADFTVRVSHLEIYNEELRDLLAPPSSDKLLKLMEDLKRGVICHNQEEVGVFTAQEAINAMKRGVKLRETAATAANPNSSRSHAIFTFRIIVKEINEEGEEVVKTGQLNLVDLAGSECIGRSGAKDDRAREAGSINQSLLTLGRVISALVDLHPHIPYRDSKLTRLLQESLGGKTRTCIIATLSPAQNVAEDTVSTIDYAYRAKSIKCQPTLNTQVSSKLLIKEYYFEIEQLKSQLQLMREKSGVYLDPTDFYHMENRLIAQENTISECESTIRARDAEIINLTEDRNNLQLQTMTQDAAIVELEALAQANEDKYQESQRQLMDLQARYTTLTQEKDELLELKHNHLEEIDRLNTLQQETDHKYQTTFEELTILQKNYEDLTVEKNSFVALSEKRAEEIADLTQKLADKTQQYDETLAQLIELQKNYEDLTVEKNSFVALSEKRAEEIADLTQKLADKTQQYDETFEQLQTLQNNYDDLMIVKNSFVALSEKQADEIADLTQKLANKTQQYDETLAQLIALQQNYDELMIIKNSYVDLSEKQADEIEDLKNKLANMTTLYEETLATLHQTQDALQKKTHECEVLTQQNADLTQQLEDLTQRFNDLTKRFEDSQQRLCVNYVELQGKQSIIQEQQENELLLQQTGQKLQEQVDERQIEVQLLLNKIQQFELHEHKQIQSMDTFILSLSNQQKTLQQLIQEFVIKHTQETQSFQQLIEQSFHTQDLAFHHIYQLTQQGLTHVTEVLQTHAQEHIDIQILQQQGFEETKTQELLSLQSLLLTITTYFQDTQQLYSSYETQLNTQHQTIEQLHIIIQENTQSIHQSIDTFVNQQQIESEKTIQLTNLIKDNLFQVIQTLQQDNHQSIEQAKKTLIEQGNVLKETMNTLVTKMIEDTLTNYQHIHHTIQSNTTTLNTQMTSELQQLLVRQQQSMETTCQQQTHLQQINQTHYDTFKQHSLIELQQSNQQLTEQIHNQKTNNSTQQHNTIENLIQTNEQLIATNYQTHTNALVNLQTKQKQHLDAIVEENNTLQTTLLTEITQQETKNKEQASVLQAQTTEQLNQLMIQTTEEKTQLTNMLNQETIYAEELKESTLKKRGDTPTVQMTLEPCVFPSTRDHSLIRNEIIQSFCPSTEQKIPEQLKETITSLVSDSF